MRRIAPTVEPNSQLGQVFIGILANKHLLVNSSGRAMIKTGQSCGLSVPLTAVLYGTAGTVVQVIRRGRVETRQVEIGLMSGGQVEIRNGLNEGDDVVARAGALVARRRPGARGDGECGGEVGVAVAGTGNWPRAQTRGRGVWVPAFAGTTC